MGHFPLHEKECRRFVEPSAFQPDGRDPEAETGIKPSNGQGATLAPPVQPFKSSQFQQRRLALSAKMPADAVVSAPTDSSFNRLDDSDESRLDVKEHGKLT